MDKSCFKSSEEKARYYSRIKYALAIGETGFFLAFCFLWQATGLSARLAAVIERLTAGAGPLVAGPAYLACFFFVYYILAFPSVFYRSFLLEHQFNLSRQSVPGFLFDQIKSGLLAYVLSAALLDAFYIAYAAYPDAWWLLAAAGWIVFNLALTYLVPLVIVPLFFTYKRLPEGALRARLSALAQAMGIRLLDIYHIDFSRRTAAANAGLIGLGSTKRVVLSDTMQQSYTDEEIAAIVAHEFMHSRSRHMFKLMLISAGLAAFFFYGVFSASPVLVSWMHVRSLSDPAAIAGILFLVSLAGFVSRPLVNAVSRRFESEADRGAVEATGSPSAFISAMEKLASQNLADPDPPAALVRLFYSHPPISERIARARARQA